MAEVTSCEIPEGAAGNVMGVGFTVNALLDWIKRITFNRSAMVMKHHRGQTSKSLFLFIIAGILFTS